MEEKILELLEKILKNQKNFDERLKEIEYKLDRTPKKYDSRFGPPC